MSSDRTDEGFLSAAFFCPQSKAPQEDYLAGLWSFLNKNTYGKALLQEISELDKAWSGLAEAKPEVNALPKGKYYVQILRNWAEGGSPTPVADARSGIVALPLLLILQTGQYLRYLEFHDMCHADFLGQVKGAGGIQGYCAGLPSALALACSRDEVELVENAAVTMRILLGVGAYAEVADGTAMLGPTTLALRLKHEEEGDELAKLFPGVSLVDPFPRKYVRSKF